MATRMATYIQCATLNVPAINAIKAKPEGDIERVFLGRILGKVRGVAVGANPHGDEPSYALTGVFEAQTDLANPDEKIRSAKCFLPKSVHNMIVGDLQKVLADVLPTKKPPAGQNVAISTTDGIEMPIAFDIFGFKSKKTVGYEFEASALIETTGAADALADLRGDLKNVKYEAPKALAAPAAKGETKPKKRAKK